MLSVRSVWHHPHAYVRMPNESSEATWSVRSSDRESLRLLIRRKLQNGRLPNDGIKKVWSSRSDGETCDGCDAILSKDQMLMEGVR
jgi:hypothetical protein